MNSLKYRLGEITKKLRQKDTYDDYNDLYRLVNGTSLYSYYEELAKSFICQINCWCGLSIDPGEKSPDKWTDDRTSREVFKLMEYLGYRPLQ